MPRLSWGQLAQEKSHALIVEVEASFFGGPKPDDPFDGHRLREAANLMCRLASRMKLSADYAATPSRGGVGQETLVLCAYASEIDRNRVADLVDARDCAVASGGWLSCRTYPLTNRTHESLIKVAGETDNRFAGQKRRKREESFAEATKLRWGEF